MTTEIIPFVDVEDMLGCMTSCAHLNQTAQVAVYSTEEHLCACFPGLVKTVPETTDGAREVIVVELKAPGYYTLQKNLRKLSKATATYKEYAKMMFNRKMYPWIFQWENY